MDIERLKKLKERLAYAKANSGDMTPEQIAEFETVIAQYSELAQEGADDELHDDSRELKLEEFVAWFERWEKERRILAKERLAYLRGTRKSWYDMSSKEKAAAHEHEAAIVRARVEEQQRAIRVTLRKGVRPLGRTDKH